MVITNGIKSSKNRQAYGLNVIGQIIVLFNSFQQFWKTHSIFHFMLIHLTNA